jgi:hypothetical protein
MGRRARTSAAAPIAGIVAAMVFAAVLAAPWVERRVTRMVGDVAVDEMRATTGMELVPLGVVAGLAAVLCGVGMLATRGVARRAAALVTVAAGGGVVVAAVVGLLRAFAMDGRITAAPWIAAPAAVAVVAAGVLGRGPGGAAECGRGVVLERHGPGAAAGQRRAGRAGGRRSGLRGGPGR